MKDWYVEELEKQREARLRDIKGHEGHIESLKDVIRQLGGEVRGLDIAIEVFTKEAAIQQAPTSTTTTSTSTLPPQSPISEKYANMPLTEAIKAVLELAGYANGVSIKQIVTELEAGGFKSKAASLQSSVYTIVKRHVKQVKFRESRTGDKRVYMKI